MKLKLLIHIMLAVGAGGMAVVFTRLRQKSVLQFWVLFILLIAPAFVFGLLHFKRNVGFDNQAAYIIGYIWTITVIGLLFSSLKRFWQRPWLVLALSPILYLIGLFVAITLGVNFGLFEPF